MTPIDREIQNIDKAICGNIEKVDALGRGLLSQNILAQLRNFVEHISLKEYGHDIGQPDIEVTWPNIEVANDYVKTRGDLRFLCKFHRFLQIVASHYTLDEEKSERLMLKYYEYLLRIKSHLKDTYNMEVLGNISKFPINTDPVLQEYYKKIVQKMDHPQTARKVSPYKDRYYIQKIKPFFVDYKIYYEVTFSIANGKTSKFDRVIAFTRLDIFDNYAVKLSVIHDSIEILGKDMPIQIIDKWEVSIRPCELNHFSDIFNISDRVNTKSLEYKRLMEYLTKSKLSLTEFVDFSDRYYESVKAKISVGAKIHFFNSLDKARFLLKGKGNGSNIVRYLLNGLNNKIIKLQRNYSTCNLLSNLCLDIGCIPFDQMPFNSSLRGHNPKISEVFDCISASGREHELLARLIKDNTETKGCLYTPIKDIVGFKDVDALINAYNKKLYLPKHDHRKLEKFNNHVYIKDYENAAIEIIKKLKDLSSTGITNYSNSVDSWLKASDRGIDCEDKEKILKQIFENSRVAFLYGAAGTGKTKLIEHISSFFDDKKKFYLANTNPAVDNLKRRIKVSDSSFKTIHRFLSKNNSDTKFDVLIIDECSTVSNSDMIEVLTKADFKLLVLVGDVYQIESITFGNWFNIAQSFIPPAAIFELTVPYRTSNAQLIELWKRVRGIEDTILEHLVKNSYATVLNESIFEALAEDEIILCLNYDGLYGINNINRFLQSNNENPAIQWGIHTYKVNDPILFNETDRFAPLIYNNLKGKIVAIEKPVDEDRIRFDVKIDKIINELDASDYDFELVGNAEDGNSIIRFYVNQHGDTDEDDDTSSDSIVPFQVAYAVSIHKAQGLEYNSVKLVITNETEEMVTHNIFYTAITRAKERLKIYWTPEAEKKILGGLERIDNKKDVILLSQRIKNS